MMAESDPQADPESQAPDPIKPIEPRPARAAKGKDESADWYRLAGVGVEFVVAIALFGGLGWLLDKWLNTQPWFLLAGCGLGFTAGLWQMLKAAGRMFKN